jgi:hypothetical protein
MKAEMGMKAESLANSINIDSKKPNCKVNKYNLL